MTSDHPLVGRRVRFEGTYRGVEGIVLAVEFHGLRIVLMLERTKHPALPPEPDGARPIGFVNIDADRGDQVFALPPDLELDALKEASEEMLDALDVWRNSKYNTGELGREGERKRLYAARTRLEQLLGRPITHPEPRICKHCNQRMPPPHIDRRCLNATDDRRSCEAL